MPAPSPMGKRTEAAGLAKTAYGMVSAGMKVVILKYDFLEGLKFPWVPR